MFNSIGGIGDKIASGNFLSAALDAYRARDTFKNADLKKTALRDITGLATDVLRGNNTQGKYFFPSVSNLVDKFGPSESKSTPSSSSNSDIVGSSPAGQNAGSDNSFAENKDAQRNEQINRASGQASNIRTR